MEHKKELFEQCPEVDAVLVISQKNRIYFTNFSSTSGYLLLTKDKETFITDFRYAEMAKPLAEKGIEVATAAGKEVFNLLNSIIADHGVKTLGFEDTELTVSDFENYKSLLPQDVTLVPVGSRINFVRRVKTDYELECIAGAQAITDKVFSKILNFIKPEVSELDIAVEIECQIRKLGGDGIAFDTIVASGENSSKPHAHPTSKKIKLGDPITMDFGAKLNGYCSDFTRTVFLGKPSKEMKNIYNIVLKAQKNVLTQMRVGLKGMQMDALAREVIAANGFAECFQHGTGHSLGLDIHENPGLSPKCEEVFEQNMLTTVEPGVYVAGLGGVRIEDLVIFKEDGIKNLTVSSKDILIL